MDSMKKTVATFFDLVTFSPNEETDQTSTDNTEATSEQGPNEKQHQQPDDEANKTKNKITNPPTQPKSLEGLIHENTPITKVSRAIISSIIIRIIISSILLRLYGCSSK